MALKTAIQHNAAVDANKIPALTGVSGTVGTSDTTGTAEIVRYGTSRMSTQYECGWCGCSLETSEEWDHGKFWNIRAPVIDPITFLDHVFEQIKHGDEEHQKWLRNKCNELAIELAKRLNEN